MSVTTLLMHNIIYRDEMVYLYKKYIIIELEETKVAQIINESEGSGILWEKIDVWYLSWQFALG